MASLMLKRTSAALLSLLVVAQAIDPPRHPHQPTGNGDRLLTYNETTPGATIRPSSTTVQWAASGDDGQFITTNDAGDLVLENIASGKKETFLRKNQLPDDLRDYWIASDQKRVLLSANATKQYRHSYFADYFVLDVASGKRTPLVDDQVGDIQYAEMAPKGDNIVFVRHNDVFLRDGSGTVTRITSNGGPDSFNGVPDWVYEEEVLGDRSALWFSPDARFVAFLSFNETGVGTYSIPYYMDNQPVAPPYPNELKLRYPKVGSRNPTVSLNLLDTKAGRSRNVPIDAFEADDLIVGEVAWVTRKHSALVYRAFNRVQDRDKHVLVDPESLTSKVVRHRDGTDGWLENTLAIQYVGRLRGGGNGTSDGTRKSSKAACKGEYYVDMSDESGWMHIYLHSVTGGDPVQLTSGDWEVRSILHVDATRGFIYYSATTQHSTESHIYKVSLTSRNAKPTPLVDDAPAVWDASFSPGGGYYILSYRGPDVPYQELYAANNTAKPLRTLTSNAKLYDTIDGYNLPNITFLELQHPDGFSLNVMQQLPPNFDPSHKYPALFTPYGGPNSQSVSKSFQSYGWASYIASEPELQFITYTVDNRGTALKGRKFRSAVTGQLGKLEPKDQVWAAEQLVKQNKFIDAGHVGMWGWSFGGYLTAKTVEENSDAFTFGLITAPVTDWRFYDSIYTERYMKTLDDNESGYNETAVRNPQGFKDIPGGVALMHGTGDDNVHFQNSAALIDLLVGSDVPPSQVKVMPFTDSDHGISYHGASKFLYKFLTARLWDEVQRKVGGEKMVHQWSRRGEKTQMVA